MNNIKTKNLPELLLFVAFFIVNLFLYLSAMNGATFSEGADATQYYYPAISLLELDGFKAGDGSPLTYGPPLYSVFLAIPIGIFGFESASAGIVFLQCVVLYFSGLIVRKFSVVIFKKESFLLHALIIFNPNSLITAHLVQSETLFTLFLVSLIFYIVKSSVDVKKSNFIMIGIIAGLLTMTRSAGIFVLYCLPFFVLIILIYHQKIAINKINYRFLKNYFWKTFLVLSVSLIVISPWSIRNYMLFDSFSLSSNKGAYLKAQYMQLLELGRGFSENESKEEVDKLHLTYLSKNNRNILCAKNDRSFECTEDAYKSVLSGLINEPIKNHVKALTSSFAYLYFTGGASNFRNYLGLPGKNNIVAFQRNKYDGLESIKSYLKAINPTYTLIFIVTTSFAILTRIFGVFGLFLTIKNGTFLKPANVAILTILIVFTAMYLYLGQSRFRVPLEPFLMIYFVIGYSHIKEKIMNFIINR